MRHSIRAFVFDAYGTLFDVHSVVQACDELFPGKGRQISEIWRHKQIEYSFLRQLMGRYRTFYQITSDALKYACNRLNITLSKKMEERLLKEYLHLQYYPEVKDVLEKLQNKQVAIFSNGSKDMLEPLAKNSGLSHLFHALISVDEVKQYKPTPMSYTSVLESLHVKREEVLFMSSNTWDIIGAKSFGFNTAWINRNGVTQEELGILPDYQYTDLYGILEHV